MTIGQLLSTFAHDQLVTYVLLLFAVDFILGVGAAVNTGTFSLSYIADILKTDVLGKMFPWFVLYAADVASHGANVAGPFDFGHVAGLAYGLLVAAMVGSIIKSLGAFGVNLPAPLARGERPGPVPPVSPVVDTRR